MAGPAGAVGGNGRLYCGGVRAQGAFFLCRGFSEGGGCLDMRRQQAGRVVLLQTAYTVLRLQIMKKGKREKHYD